MAPSKRNAVQNVARELDKHKDLRDPVASKEVFSELFKFGRNEPELYEKHVSQPFKDAVETMVAVKDAILEAAEAENPRAGYDHERTRGAWDQGIHAAMEKVMGPAQAGQTRNQSLQNTADTLSAGFSAAAAAWGRGERGGLAAQMNELSARIAADPDLIDALPPEQLDALEAYLEAVADPSRSTYSVETHAGDALKNYNKATGGGNGRYDRHAEPATDPSRMTKDEYAVQIALEIQAALKSRDPNAVARLGMRGIDDEDLAEHKGFKLDGQPEVYQDFMNQYRDGVDDQANPNWFKSTFLGEKPDKGAGVYGKTIDDVTKSLNETPLGKFEGNSVELEDVMRTGFQTRDNILAGFIETDKAARIQNMVSAYIDLTRSTRIGDKPGVNQSAMAMLPDEVQSFMHAFSNALDLYDQAKANGGKVGPGIIALDVTELIGARDRLEFAVDTAQRAVVQEFAGRAFTNGAAQVAPEIVGALGTFFGSDAMKRIADELLADIDKSTAIPPELKTHAYFKAIAALGNLTTNLALGLMTGGLGLTPLAFNGVKTVSLAAGKIMAANVARSGVSVNAAINMLAAGGKKANELRAAGKSDTEQLKAAITGAGINWLAAGPTSSTIGGTIKSFRDKLDIPNDITTQTLVDAFSAYAGGKMQSGLEGVFTPEDKEGEQTPY